MKEKIAQWLYSDSKYGDLITWDDLANCAKDNFRVRANRLLSLLKEEIKKAENPHTKAYKIGESEAWTSTPEYRGFEDCRQAILRILEKK